MKSVQLFQMSVKAMIKEHGWFLSSALKKKVPQMKDVHMRT